MGDKYGPPRSAGLPTKLNLTKNKLKIVIVVSLLLVLLVRSTAPFGGTDSPRRRRAEAQGSSIVGEIAGARALQNEDGQRQGEDSGEPPASLTKPPTVTANATDDSSERHILEQDEKLESNGIETISEPQTLKESDEEHGNNGIEAISEPQALKESDEELDDSTIEAISERETLKQGVQQDHERDHGREEDGNRRSISNTLRTQIFDEIRAQSLNYTTLRTRDSRNSSCEGKHIYVYELPPEFNVDLAARCDSLFPAFNLCDFFADFGTGKPVDNPKNNDSQIFVPPDRWFNTHQYALELVSHARVKRYKCLTKNAEQAALFYIPFYAGLDVIRWNFARDSTNEKRDALSLKLLTWLEKQPSWRRRGGRDHVLVLGKISWDFRRQQDGGEWGNRLLELPDTQKMTKVLIERNPWSLNDIGVPHPTFFHPQSASDITTWLHHIRSQNRTSLVAFVGKERPGTSNVRSALVRQCRNASSSSFPSGSSSGSGSGSSPTCRFVECVHNRCQVPAFVTQAFLTTHFCMQPVGDSPTRRSVFDSLIAGCIPVLFHPCTAYVQYPWHLPRNESAWSVYISEDEVKRGEVNVVEVLRKVSVQQREAMRETIVGEVVPGLLYSAPGSDVWPYRDAFDITIEQLLHRVSRSEQGEKA